MSSEEIKRDYERLYRRVDRWKQNLQYPVSAQTKNQYLEGVAFDQECFRILQKRQDTKSKLLKKEFADGENNLLNKWIKKYSDAGL
jgi:hypothetical protein